jgi:hypothetical protein
MMVSHAYRYVTGPQTIISFGWYAHDLDADAFPFASKVLREDYERRVMDATACDLEDSIAVAGLAALAILGSTAAEAALTREFPSLADAALHVAADLGRPAGPANA